MFIQHHNFILTILLYQYLLKGNRFYSYDHIKAIIQELLIISFYFYTFDVINKRINTVDFEH